MQKQHLAISILEIIRQVEKYQSTLSDKDASHKNFEMKWSKKEILGHLTDSAVINIKRVTEIQFMEKPYAVHVYDQNHLVTANAYQQKSFAEIFDLWKEMNKHIAYLISIQTEATSAYEVQVTEINEIKTLGWLMEDYVRHLDHHLRQIIS